MSIVTGTATAVAKVDGLKTYAVSGTVIVLALMEGPLGWDIPGVDIGDNWFDYMMAGAFGGTFRSALKKLFPN